MVHAQYCAALYNALYLPMPSCAIIHRYFDGHLTTRKQNLWRQSTNEVNSMIN